MSGEEKRKAFIRSPVNLTKILPFKIKANIGIIKPYFCITTALNTMKPISKWSYLLITNRWKGAYGGMSHRIHQLRIPLYCLLFVNVTAKWTPEFASLNPGKCPITRSYPEYMNVTWFDSNHCADNHEWKSKAGSAINLHHLRDIGRVKKIILFFFPQSTRGQASKLLIHASARLQGEDSTYLKLP